ncbi:MAG TPA: HD domain-containing phosphohydrolase [Rectinemataceae bacterium]|nr:HD domain-containing phosphohydrolase [Rectinemataceae bacterium]
MAKATILCVDDDPANLALLDAILSPLGYVVARAADGKAALEKVAELAVDLILLDVMLPGLSGFEVCKTLKTDDRYRKIPVVLITALNSREDRIRGTEAGAEDFVTKPFDKLEVLARIEMLLRVRRLDRHMEGAYALLKELTAFSEREIGDFDPMRFDFGAHVDRLTSQLLRPGNPSIDSPGWLIISIMSDADTRNMVYRLSSGGVTNASFASSLLHNYFPKGVAPSGFLNEQDLGESKWRFVRDTMQHVGLDSSNFVYFHDERFTILAGGYPEEATDHHATVINNLVLQIMLLRSLAQQVRETEEAFLYTIHALARAAEANDEDTGNHVLRVGEYAASIAKGLGQSSRFVEDIRVHAPMHDVGKIHTPPQILRKRGPLDPEELRIMRQHPTQGAGILGEHPRLAMAREIALSHHERWDGSGYPNGLKGERIPLAGRIVMVADQYDALRSKRSYKEAFDHDTACAVLLRGDGRSKPEHLDPAVLEVFAKSRGEFEEISRRLADN